MKELLKTNNINVITIEPFEMASFTGISKTFIQHFLLSLPRSPLVWYPLPPPVLPLR